MRRKLKQILAFAAIFFIGISQISGIRPETVYGAKEESGQEAIPADGTYTPDSFSWSGGSGRVSITCDEITVSEGKAWADIVFGSPYYSYVKVNGETYNGTVDGDTTRFHIPVILNQNNTIVGMTTKMSADHEISYTICVYVETKKDEEAPEIGAPKLPGLTPKSRMELKYAKGFDVYNYQDGYKLLDVHDSQQYLVVPEGKEAPDGLDNIIRVLNQPLDTIYMAATSPMSLFDALDCTDRILFSGITAQNWTVEAAADAMDSGSMSFAGKYNEPDYELLLSEGCDLAVESTMILHDPKVQELIEMLGIPVFVDRSSYETHPLGRTEWIRLYGAMLNKEEDADSFFEEQAKVIDRLKDFPNTEKKVAFFFINTSGSPVVRDPDDYISNMIEIAGGRNAFAELQNDSGKTSIPVTMEEFYDTAVDADYLIYNGSIDSSVKTMEDLLAKSSVLSDFKAVKEGNVWVTSSAMYQATGTIGELISDVNLMLTEGDPDEMTFLSRLS